MLSPFHFHRVFRAVTGEGVAEHRRRLSLEQAATRLRTTNRPFLEIALEAGYEAHESFTRRRSRNSRIKARRTRLCDPDPQRSVQRPFRRVWISGALAASKVRQRNRRRARSSFILTSPV